jgi:hypothetical protein
VSSNPFFDMPRSYHEARIRRIEHVLDSYGVLTRRWLYVLSGANKWESEESFRHVIDEAVREGRVRPLGGSLFESAKH